MITQKRLHELFDYDNGLLIRKGNIKGRLSGSVLGTLRPRGYMVGVVDNEMYRVHHLVWMYHHGEFVKELDHINRIKNDNRIENLRPCNHSQNLGNVVPRKHKYKGVTFCKQTNKWRARLNVCLGRYPTIGLAALAYNKAAIEYFGEFAYLNKVDDEDC